MRLLFDEQPSSRLCSMLASVHPDSLHRLSILRGAPPRVIWIRLGNAPTEEIARLLRERREDILRFESQDDATFLSLGW